MRLTIVFLALCTVLVSCNKDKTASKDTCKPVITLNHSNDTIFPSDYLMAYPGSWWQYDNGFIDSCKYWEAVPIRNTTTNGECVFIDEDSWILSEGLIYSGNNIGFDQIIITIGDYDSTQFYPLFDTIVGVYYDETFQSGSGEYSGTTHSFAETLERLDSMTIGINTYYDVIHVKGASDVVYQSGGGPNFFSERWFAKHVGLIKMLRGEGISVVTDIELVNHHIAPH